MTFKPALPTSLTRRLLLQVTIGAAVVIAVSTAVTYYIVYDAMRKRDLERLDAYVNERVRREGAAFRQIASNLELVRALFLRRTSLPLPRDLERRWDERFERFPDGAWRSKREFVDGRRWSTLWMHREATLTPQLQADILRAQDICNDLLAGWVDSFPSVYFFFEGPCNIGYDPRIPSWVWDTPADYDVRAMEWYPLAWPAASGARELQWTAVLEEATSHAPMVSAFLPIYRDDQLVGSVAHDVWLQRLFDETARSEMPGAGHFILRADGRLIAHAALRERIVSSKGLLTAEACGDPFVARVHRAIRSHPAAPFTGFDAASGLYYSVARLAGPEWAFVMTMPAANLRAQAFRSAQWVLWSGLLSLALLLLVFLNILRRQLAHPLSEFLSATRRLAAGERAVRVQLPRDDELGELAHAFNDMEESMEARGAALRESEQRWRALVEQSPLSVQIFSREGKTLLVNRAFEEFWGVPFSALKDYSILADQQLEANGVAPLVRKAFAGEVVAVPAARYDVAQTPELHGAPPRERWLTALLYPLLDDAGRVREVICVHQDITAAKTAEDQIRAANQGLEQRVNERTEELRRANAELQQEVAQRAKAEQELAEAVARERELSELKSNFVSMVSHEFRTPLGVIMSAADVLDRYLDRLPEEERRDHLDMIFRSTRNLAQLVESVLLLGKVEEGRLHFEPAPLDLAATCAALVDEVLSATAHRCPVELVTRGELHGAEADADLLRHILTNLLSNAIKYSETGSPVTLELARRGACAVISVSDRGIGIPDADQANLFKSFARGRNVGQRPGSGLGLLIVKRCAEQHGGTVRVASRVGAGTVATVELPVFVPNLSPV